MKNKAFTLVELLAVIVILAVILVIAIPQIMSVIKTTRMSSFKDSAILIATNAEKYYLSNRVLNPEYDKTSIDCSDVAKLNDDYSYCNIKYKDSIAYVTLNGKMNGKFSNIYCNGTKDNMKCVKKEIANNENAVSYLTNIVGEMGLIIDDYGDIRYQGSNNNIKNYVTFNNELWRIVGVFNTQKEVDGLKEKRVKLVRNDSLGGYAWDSSELSINGGEGVNEWSEADLMNELNSDYLDYSLNENRMWYNGGENKKEAVFYKEKVLNENSQELIDSVLWYLGGESGSKVSLESQYIAERTSKHINNPSDHIERKDNWIGKVGLIYASDYGYASSNENCALNIGINENCDNNWMSNYGYTITVYSSNTKSIFISNNPIVVNRNVAKNPFAVRPSIYLKPNVLISGEGTIDKPYTFSLN